MASAHQLMAKLDEVKQKLTSQEYKELADGLMVLDKSSSYTMLTVSYPIVDKELDEDGCYNLYYSERKLIFRSGDVSSKKVGGLMAIGVDSQKAINWPQNDPLEFAHRFMIEELKIMVWNGIITNIEKLI